MILLCKKYAEDKIRTRACSLAVGIPIHLDQRGGNGINSQCDFIQWKHQVGAV